MVTAKSRLDTINARIVALREARKKAKVGSPEWLALDNQLFEARSEARFVRAALDGRSIYRCESCGKVYDSLWVRYNGLRCDVECDGHLFPVEPQPAPGFRVAHCPECQGNGYVEAAGPDFYSESHGYWLPNEQIIRCPRCGGSGEEGEE